MRRYPSRKLMGINDLKVFIEYTSGGQYDQVRFNFDVMDSESIFFTSNKLHFEHGVYQICIQIYLFSKPDFRGFFEHNMSSDQLINGLKQDWTKVYISCIEETSTKAFLN